MILPEICKIFGCRYPVGSIHRSLYNPSNPAPFRISLLWPRRTFFVQTLLSSKQKSSMPTKQATLGYVNPSQKTLRCAVRRLRITLLQTFSRYNNAYAALLLGSRVTRIHSTGSPSYHSPQSSWMKPLLLFPQTFQRGTLSLS